MASFDYLRTLYEDWQSRRDRLLLTSTCNDVYQRIQLRILDYLLRRYHHAPEARRTVAFPRLADLSTNDRVLVVHQHLARRGGPRVSSSAEACLRIQSALERMYSTEPSESRLASPSGEHPSRNQEIDQLYLRLCHREGRQRVLAAVELGERGTLEDIGLLCDLLALPPDGEEHPRERTALGHALARLAGVTSTRFDLNDMIPSSPKTNDAEDLNEMIPSSPKANDAEDLNGIDDWICRKCRASVPANFEICWSCGTTIGGKEDPTFLAAFHEEEADSHETPSP